MPDRETWNFVNSFAPWFAALGTVMAASVALYLGLSARKTKLQLVAGVRLEVQPGRKIDHDEHEIIFVQATNVGHRTVVITNFDWRLGRLRKHYFIQLPGSEQSPRPMLGESQLPCKIEPGERAQYIIAACNWLDGIENFFPNWFTRTFPRLWLRSLKIQAHTSFGDTVTRPAENALRQRILKAWKKREPDESDKN